MDSQRPIVPLRFTRLNANGSKVIPSRRHQRLLPAALAFLTLSEQSLSLILLPGQQRLSGHQCSIQSCTHHGLQTRHCHRRRKRSLHELQLHEFQLHSSSSLILDHVHLINSNSPPNHFPLSPLFLHAHLQKCMPTISHSSFSHDRRHNGIPSRMSSSLFMTQSSDSAAGFGKNDDRNKKKDGGSDSKSKHNSKRNKGITKGASSSLGNNVASDRPNNKAKRPKRRNNKKDSSTKQKNGTKKSYEDKSKKAKTKTSSNYDTKALQKNRSSIKTSDGSNSLKSFKSELPPQQMEEETAISGIDDGDQSTSDDKDAKRIQNLEILVSKQQGEIQKLRREIEELTKATSMFTNVVDVLREAGLRIDEDNEVAIIDEEVESDNLLVGTNDASLAQQRSFQQQTIMDDMEIFGIAPKSVTDAADAAGASILSAILAGKHRMLVDVRDAELSRDPKLFVEFVELAILPVAAGLEGLDDGYAGEESVRDRVKIVFPTVKGLVSYRRSMALAAPEVVSLSTLGFDPVDDERDNLIVVIAPRPDDVTAVKAMDKLIQRTRRNYVEPDCRITQPVVVLNHHMVPIDMAGFGKFTAVYHLRLLSVQYMTGDSMPEYVAKGKSKEGSEDDGDDSMGLDLDTSSDDTQNHTKSGMDMDKKSEGGDEEDAALEAAMTHAHEIGVHQGVTRAMVIRAYPKPWHVFVDTSPDTDADFEVAATFDTEPTQEDVNYAIVECLEGSEKEDEIVAQQMQAALEAGQLNRVSNMLGISPLDIVSEDKGASSSSEADDSKKDDPGSNLYQDGNDDWDDIYYDDWFSEDSV